MRRRKGRKERYNVRPFEGSEKKKKNPVALQPMEADWGEKLECSIRGGNEGS